MLLRAPGGSFGQSSSPPLSNRRPKRVQSFDQHDSSPLDHVRVTRCSTSRSKALEMNILFFNSYTSSSTIHHPPSDFGLTAFIRPYRSAFKPCFACESNITLAWVQRYSCHCTADHGLRWTPDGNLGRPHVFWVHFFCSCYNNRVVSKFMLNILNDSD
jgi:hypothetical protein